MTGSQIWRHCKPPGTGPVTYTITGSALGWLYTCPYCLTQIDSHSYQTEQLFETACEAHLTTCRDHVGSNAVRDAMRPLTEKKDRLGRPVYNPTGGNQQ